MAGAHTNCASRRVVAVPATWTVRGTVVVGLLVVFAAACTDSADPGDDAGATPSTPSTRPASPSPSDSPTPTPIGASTGAWEPPEPLRPAASRVVRHNEDSYGYGLDWDDPRDVAIAEIDIVSVAEAFDFSGGSSWSFRLAARAPLDPAGRVIAYGVVVDGDGDRKADCRIGINNDAPQRGNFQVWVTNLRTHETAINDGSRGYGMPVEFAHPAERVKPQPDMDFGFLRGLKNPDPCDPFGEPSTYYVWSSVTEAGQVIARDYAPDAAWLPIMFGR